MNTVWAIVDWALELTNLAVIIFVTVGAVMAWRLESRRRREGK